MATRPIERISISDAVAEDLRKRILCGEIAEGIQLRQETLAAEYHVSRMPVREALKQLEAEGLVTFSPYKGAEVTSLSPDTLTEVLDLRALIEPDLLRRSIPNMKKTDILAAERSSRAFDRALQGNSGDASELGRYNWDLHAALYRPAGRERTMQFLQTLHYHAERYTRLHVMLAHGRKRASKDHANLIKHCREGDVEAACSLLRQHIEAAEHDLLAFIDEQRESGG